MELEKSENGIWNFSKRPSKIDPTYEKFLLQSVNAIDKVFDEAKNRSEFEFILTLLGVRGLSDAGWDPFETTKYVFGLFSDLLNSKLSFKESIHYSLLLYGHLVEASEPYEIICNMINIGNGGRYRSYNFPEKGERKRPQSPSEKIRKLEELAITSNQKDVLQLFNTFYDRELRNSIFHSDYSVYGSELRIKTPIKVYKHAEIMNVINQCIAYYNALINIIDHSKSVYKEPKIIDVHPEFSRYPNEKAITIIRQGDGLVGLKDNLTPEQKKSGFITFRVGKFLPYELKIIDYDPSLVILPHNKIEKTNKLIKIFPSSIRRKIVKYLSKNIYKISS